MEPFAEQVAELVITSRQRLAVVKRAFREMARTRCIFCGRTVEKYAGIKSGESGHTRPWHVKCLKAALTSTPAG